MNVSPFNNKCIILSNKLEETKHFLLRKHFSELYPYSREILQSRTPELGVWEGVQGVEKEGV